MQFEFLGKFLGVFVDKYPKEYLENFLKKNPEEFFRKILEILGKPHGGNLTTTPDRNPEQTP